MIITLNISNAANLGFIMNGGDNMIEKDIRFGIKYKDFQLVYEKRVRKSRKSVQTERLSDELKSQQPVRKLDYYA